MDSKFLAYPDFFSFCIDKSEPESHVAAFYIQHILLFTLPISMLMFAVCKIRVAHLFCVVYAMFTRLIFVVGLEDVCKTGFFDSLVIMGAVR